MSKESEIKIWDVVPGLDFIEEIDVPEIHSWFLAGAYCTPPWTPLFGWFWINHVQRGIQMAAAELSIPNCKGWVQRYWCGGLYCGLYIVRDKKEIADREVKFRQALRPWMEDFDGIWNGYKKELLEIYAKLKSLDVDNATNYQLYQHNLDLVAAHRRMFELHMLPLYASNNAWLLLDEMARKRFGIKDTDPDFQDMMAGFSNKIYEMDKEIWKFGRLAKEMGLESLFKENGPKTIVAKLQQFKEGKEWFKKLINYLESDDIGGWRMVRATDLTEPYWLEDPSIPISLIKDSIARGTDYELDNIRNELVSRREAAIANFLKRIPPVEQIEWEELIRLSGKSSSFSEEHNLYCELKAHALMRRGYLAMGRRLVQNNTIDQPEDIFMLNPDEINRVMIAPEYHDLRWITNRRRAAWDEWQTRPNPFLFTDRADLEEAVKMDLLPSGDSIAIKITVGELPEVKPELNADIFGLCGCAGNAVGIARVCFTYEDLKDVNPGEILVCPGTNPAWTTIFGIVNGVITDTGGPLCHAAIIGREYGVPTITNTQIATQKIKTGQWIRIEADKGAVIILDK